MSQPFQRKENQSFTSDNSQIDEKGDFPSSIEEKEYCESFQQKLDAQYINTIWVRFSEKSGTNDTKGKKLLSKKYFTHELTSYLKEDKVLGSNHDMASSLVNELFERFKNEGDNDNIDIQDLMIAFTILSRMKEDQKLKEIFKLTDIDGDDCLSIEDIHQMIRRIERVFCKEMVHVKNDSSHLLTELALIQAERKFGQTVFGMGKESQADGVDEDQDKFISWAEFYESLQNKPLLKSKFLPNNFQLASVLANRKNEIKYTVSDHDDLEDFRRIMHLTLRKHYTLKDYRSFMTTQNKQIPLPGQLEQDYNYSKWNNEWQYLQQRDREDKQLQQNQQMHHKKANKDNNRDQKPPPKFDLCNPITNWQGFKRLQESFNDKKQAICSKKSDTLLDMVANEKKKEKQSHEKSENNSLQYYQQIVKEMGEQAIKQEFARDKREKDKKGNGNLNKQKKEYKY